MHPLVPNLENMSEQDITAKLGDLYKKMAFANRTGNGALLSQLRMVIDDYQSEFNKRKQAELQKLSKDNNFDDFINIG
jgi:hypothetical protein